MQSKTAKIRGTSHAALKTGARRREKEMELFYRHQAIGKRRADFFVEGRVLVELKAIEQLQAVHKAQTINYCEAYKIPDGLLINFGSTSLDFKRVYGNSPASRNE